MIKRKILALLLLFFFTFTILSTFAEASDQLNESDLVPQPPALTISAKAAYLMDASTGDVLYTMNECDQLYPASTTKIMTCYLTLKYGNLNDLYTLPSGISTGMDESASTCNLQPGEELYISELLQCLMISSANEAANALAIYISGSISEFVALMNEEAQELGCTGTHFDNPNGLHSSDHYTTAKDLAIITVAALQYDTFRDICGTASATIRSTNLSEERNLENTNYLLPGTDFPGYDYDGTEGVKTGHTTPAGYCLVSLAQRNGHELLGVVLGASETVNGDQVQIGSFTESIQLLDWGFENYQSAIIYQEYLAANENNSRENSPEQNSAQGVADGTDMILPDDISTETSDPSDQKDMDITAAVSNEAAADHPADSRLEPAVSSDSDAFAAYDSATTAENIAAYPAIQILEPFSATLGITDTDLILLLAGLLIMLLLTVSIIFCCIHRRKLEKNHAL